MKIKLLMASLIIAVAGHLMSCDKASSRKKTSEAKKENKLSTFTIKKNIMAFEADNGKVSEVQTTISYAKNKLTVEVRYQDDTYIDAAEWLASTDPEVFERGVTQDEKLGISKILKKSKEIKRTVKAEAKGSVVTAHISVEQIKKKIEEEKKKIKKAASEIKRKFPKFRSIRIYENLSKFAEPKAITVVVDFAKKQIIQDLED